ncbi:MAG: hypothetical protein WAW86_07915 [Gammaproteobacteria bacterium]
MSSSTESVVLLDVDETLILDTGEFDQAGRKKTVVNNFLIDGLKALKLKNIILFTNMTVGGDLNAWIDNPNHITRKQLIDFFEARDIPVAGVIMPADVEYKKGLGASFHDFYKPAYEVLINANSVHDDRNKRLPDYAEKVQACHAHTDALVERIRLEGNQRPGSKDTKREMFSYLLSRKKSSFLVHYFDDDKACLDAVDGFNKITTPCFKLKTYQMKEDGSNIPRELTHALGQSDNLLGQTEEYKGFYCQQTVVTSKRLLDAYVSQREHEVDKTGSHYHSAWARLFSIGGGRDSQVKISAAQKLMAYLNDDDHQQLNKDEMSACQNGRLKDLINSNPVLGCAFQFLCSPRNQPASRA